MMVLPFSARTGFNAPCEPTRWKVEDFLTGFAFLSGVTEQVENRKARRETEFMECFFY
jgi:hypothetical protein